MDSTTDQLGPDAQSPLLVLLPGLDGTGKLFAEFLRIAHGSAVHSLPKISVPALVLCATRDRVVSETATRRIMRGIAHAQRVDIEGPHLLLQTCAAECAAAVLSFLENAAVLKPVCHQSLL